MGQIESGVLIVHSLILGTTEAGKTTLAKMIAKSLKEKGHPIAVLDPFEDDAWPHDFITSNDVEFLEYVKCHRDLFIFVDETAQSIGRYNDPMQFLATTARHLGHSSFFIGHRFTQIDPVIRSNATRAFVFTTDKDSAMLLATEFVQPELSHLPRFKKGQFCVVSRWRDIEYCAIDFDRKKVDYMPNRKESVPRGADTSGVSESSE